jgi:hypothetical protein
VRVLILDLIPTWKRFSAIALPPVGILVRRSWWCEASFSQRGRLLRHEQVHWWQYQQLGLLRYYYNYLTLALFYGYQDHPMEIEARTGQIPGPE